MTRALVLQDVVAGYGQAMVLQRLSLQVREGSITVLLGSNGAGKTTLMRVIAGLLKPRHGSAELFGNDLFTMAGHDRVGAGLALTPEGRSVLPELSVWENLRMGAFSFRTRRDCAALTDEMFDTFPRLAERQHQRASTLSGGEQQMLAIARSLMSRPRLLLLDEPSLGLAPIVVRQVFDIVAKIRDRGISVLMVEQNAAAALAIADDAYVIEHGSVCLSGPAHALRADPKVREAYLGL